MSSENAKEVDKKIRESFLYFLFLIWRHLNLPKPTALQNSIGLALVNSEKRTIISAFRGCGKSFITAAYVIWLLYRDYDTKVMVVSASKERADAFSLFVKRLIDEIPWLSHLKPGKGQRDSLVAFDVGPAVTDQSPSVRSLGITSQLTGSRANVIIADDIEVPSNSYTQTARDRLGELVKEFDAILKPYDAKTMRFQPKIIYLGTPQTEQSLYNALAEDRGYDMLIWPAEFPQSIERYKGRLSPFITKPLEEDIELRGKPTEPGRFTMTDLMERKASYGKSGYALQFMLDTSLSDADRYPLKLADLIISTVGHKKAPAELSVRRSKDHRNYELPAVGLAGDYYYNADWVSDTRREYTGSLLVIDPSGRGKDETAYCVLKELNGFLFLAEQGGYADGYGDATLKALAGIAKKHGCHRILIESNFGDGMFNQLLQPFLKKVYPCTTEEVKNQGQQKERRIIETLEPVLMQHRLVVDPSVVATDYESTLERPQYSLFYQMTRMTSERGCIAQDDRLDCLSMGVKWYTSRMAIDSSAVEDKRRQKQLEALIKNPALLIGPGAKASATLSGVLGMPGTKKNWVRR